MLKQLAFSYNTYLQFLDFSKAFDRADHSVLIRKLFSSYEMDLLEKCFLTEDFKKHVFTRSDGGEKGFQMALWWEPGNDTAGLVTRSRRIVNTMQTFLGGEKLYHLSSKLIMKEAESGGAFAWHQVDSPHVITSVYDFVYKLHFHKSKNDVA